MTKHILNDEDWNEYQSLKQRDQQQWDEIYKKREENENTPGFVNNFAFGAAMASLFWLFIFTIIFGSI